ncbi:MAG: NTP transferase domain-containing protein [Bacteroidales bacterium]|nr:NTP transferase domain-containing protein [Bacteroidales bacterium]MBK7627515.1 NTP transferase domain-containing protein [Bacteroidales bacterium]
MKAMIFAAGLGKRLGKITETIPKALVDIDGKTALHLAVEKCTAHGFDDIIVNVHHFADMVEKEILKLNKMGYKISVSDEREKLLETGGGLYKARDFFDDTPFLIYNVDIISDLDISSLYRFHTEKKGLATLAVRHRPGNRFYLIDQEGIIRGWRNNATGEQILTSQQSDNLSEIAFSSMHIVEPEVFKFMEEGVYTMTALYLKLARDHKIYTYLDDTGYWGDIGTPESLEYIRGLFNK